MCYDQPDFRSYKGIESRGIIKKKEDSLEERVRWKSFEVCLRLMSHVAVGQKLSMIIVVPQASLHEERNSRDRDTKCKKRAASPW